jgi:hypothetical protein
MLYRLLAAVVDAGHLAYVLFVVLGLFTIYLGQALGWRWVHNRWFRGIHFLMIAIVAVEAMANIDCPLTTLARYLREQGGEVVSDDSFMERLLRAVLFPALPQWVFPILHIGFAVLVLSTFWVVPVRWRKEREPAETLASDTP